MKLKKTSCKSVQRTLAVGSTLTPAQQLHMDHCPYCAAAARSFQQVDTLIRQGTADLTPAGFNEQLMARLQSEPCAQSATCTPVFDKLLAYISQSRLLRNIAISLGLALGIGQLIQLILGIFFVGMMAAM